MEIIAYAIATPNDFVHKNLPLCTQKSATCTQKSATCTQKSATFQHAQNHVFLRCKWRCTQKSATTQHGVYKNLPVCIQKSATLYTKICHLNPLVQSHRIAPAYFIITPAGWISKIIKRYTTQKKIISDHSVIY